MAIQYADGPLVVRPDDWQATVSGVTIAVKLRYLDSLGQTMALLLEKVDGDWTSKLVLDADIQPAEIAAAGGAAGYINANLVPKINTWMTQRFSAAGMQVSPAQEVAGMMGKLSVVFTAGIPQVKL